MARFEFQDTSERVFSWQPAAANGCPQHEPSSDGHDAFVVSLLGFEGSLKFSQITVKPSVWRVLAECVARLLLSF